MKQAGPVTTLARDLLSTRASLNRGCLTHWPTRSPSLLQDLKMARSLTVKHEEKPATSLIMTAFLVLAVVWMAASAVFASPTPETPAAAPQLSSQ